MVKKLHIIIVIFVLMTFIMVMFVGCDNAIVIAPVELDYGNFEKRYDDVDFDLVSFDTAIINGADKVAALEHMLNVAITNYDNADHVAKIAMGSGEAFTGGMGGKMTVRSIYMRNDVSYYYQIAGLITEASPSEGLSAAQIMLNQERREYTADGVTFYQQEPTNNKGKPAMITDYPYMTCDYSKGTLQNFDLEAFKVERNIKEDVGEFTSFVFNGDTISEDTIEITFDEEFGIYTLKYSLNLADETARNTATEFPRTALREISNSDNIEYKKYDVTMEIWDSGLIRSYATDESWEGSITVWVIHLDGSSTSYNKDYYSWDPDDCDYAGNGIDVAWAG